jgi:hypothetical protein
MPFPDAEAAHSGGGVPGYELALARTNGQRTPWRRSSGEITIVEFRRTPSRTAPDSCELFEAGSGSDEARVIAGAGAAS